jgi:hypothetical protein
VFKDSGEVKHNVAGIGPIKASIQTYVKELKAYPGKSFKN